MSTVTQTDQEMTEQVADNYAESLVALDDLSDAVEELRGRAVEIDRRHLWGALGVVLADATDAGRRRDEALDQFDSLNDADELNDGAGVGDLWLRDVLEIYADGRRSMGDRDGWSITSMGVLLSYGGPNVRLTCYGGRASMALTVDWASSHASRLVYCPTVADALSNLEDVITDSE